MSRTTGALQLITCGEASTAVLRPVQDVLNETISVKGFGAEGDGSTNDTVAIQKALTYIGAAGGSLYFPAGTYMVSTLTLTTSFPVRLFGAGRFLSSIRRHSGSLQASTDLILITTTSRIEISQMGFDQRGDGTNFQKACITISGATGITFTENYVTGGQSVGLQGTDCDNVVHCNNYYYQNWWFGASFSTSSPTAAPVYHYNYRSSGNLYENQPIGIGFNFFLSDITVTGEVFRKSGLDFVQMLHARATVSNIVIDGTSTYGFTSNPQDGIFCEGVSDISISSVYIRNITSEAGIRFQGSNLTIPGGGTTIQLPCSNVTIDGVLIESVNSNYPIAFAGTSISGTVGTNYTQRNVTIVNSHSGGVVAGVNHVAISGLYVDTCNVGGLTLAGVQDFKLSDFKFRNVGSASPASYAGILITNTTLNGYISNGVITNDSGNSLAYSLQDNVLNAGTATQIRIQDVQFSGISTLPAFTAAPTIGAWNAGDIVSIGALGFVCTTAGTPGTWNNFTAVPSIKGNVSAISQTASISATNLNTAALTTGLYRVSWRVRSTTVAATPGPGQVQPVIAWTDELFGVTTTLGTLALGATGTPAQQGVYVFWNTGTNVTYSTAYVACTSGTGTYNLQLELEKLA